MSSVTETHLSATGNDDGNDGGNDRAIFLGVDGGGTKTAFALVTAHGDLLASDLAPSSYYLGRSIDLVRDVLAEGVHAVCSQADITLTQVSYAFFAFPGYGEVSRDLPALNAIPAGVLGHDRYGCDNDMVAGWAGSLGGVDGVNVIAGTGSMTYGAHQGRGLRVGGWGELFDDEGSAYWIAIRGLNAFAKMSDGRLTKGPLHPRMAEHLHLEADLDLVDVVLNRWRGDRSKIAALARVVTAAANHGDLTSKQILSDAGRALAGLVKNTISQLEYAENDTVPVSWSGGVFASHEVRAAFRAELANTSVELRDPLLLPVLGAALYAARLAQTPLTREAVTRLQAAAHTVPQGGHDD